MPHNNANSNVYVYKDKRYDALFTRTLGWNGGDGVQTTLLPGGNVFWSFNDSFYGRATDASSRIRRSSNFPRNSLMVQTPGEDGLPGAENTSFVWLADWVQREDSTAEGYYHCRTHLRHPNGEKTEAQIRQGEIDQTWLYWAGDATVVDGRLQMLWAGVYNGTQNLMQPRNRALAVYSLEGNPGSPEYLKLLSVDHNFIVHDPIGYGSPLWEDADGHTYLFLLSVPQERGRPAKHLFAHGGAFTHPRPPFALGILRGGCFWEVPLAKHISHARGSKTFCHQQQERGHTLGFQGRRLVLHDGTGICLCQGSLYHAKPHPLGTL